VFAFFGALILAADNADMNSIKQTIGFGLFLIRVHSRVYPANNLTN